MVLQPGHSAMNGVQNGGLNGYPMSLAAQSVPSPRS